MATDGPDLAPCAEDIYKNGTLVFQTHSIGGSNAIERWVRAVAKGSGQPVDWHFAGGRVCVLALGDLEKVKWSIRRHIHHHDKNYRKTLRGLKFSHDDGYRPRPAWWNDAARAEPFTAPAWSRARTAVSYSSTPKRSLSSTP